MTREPGKGCESAKSFFLHFTDADDFCRGAKFLIIPESLFLFYIEVLEQSHAHIYLRGNVLRKPDFIIDSCLLERYPRALMNSGQE